MDRSERVNSFMAAANQAAREQRADMWTALPATVSKYDATKHTVEAQPTIKQRLRDKKGNYSWVQMPLCLDCPVHYPQGGGYTLTFPIAKDDEGLLIFASRCIDSWWKEGGIQPQADLRMHNISDGFFIPGVRSQKKKLSPAAATDKVQLRSDDGKRHVEIGSDYILGQIDQNSKSRFVATTKASEIKFGSHFVAVSNDGVIVSEDPVVGPDPDPAH